MGDVAEFITVAISTCLNKVLTTMTGESERTVNAGHWILCAFLHTQKHVAVLSTYQSRRHIKAAPEPIRDTVSIEKQDPEP